MRDPTYWDATYTGYVDASRYEKWPFVFTEAEDFSVTAAPNGDGLTTLIILLDAGENELARGTGTLTSSQPPGNYYVQVQPETGGGFYDLTIRRVDMTEPPTTDPSSTTTAEPASLKVGETSIVSVSLDNIPAEGYTSAEFTCTYDMSLVEVGNIVVTDLFGADSATAINGPAEGSFIVAVAGINGNKATADGVAFTFSAKGLQVGTAAIACVARVSTGDNILTEVESTSASLVITDDVIVVEDSTLTGQVFAGKAVTVSLYDAADTLVKSAAADVDGNFSLTVPAGTYTVVATASGFLGAEGSATLTANETSTMPAVTLLAGDIDGNDVIDQFDAMTIGMSYNGTDPAAADLNNDGIINVLDLELLAANYRLTGPVVWQ
ncbi:MAG TPA: carboxypeptidase regulatory-like domain-containing protein [Anaerolineales bacterium]